MLETLIKEMVDNGLRPGRIYGGKYKASECGRSAVDKDGKGVALFGEQRELFILTTEKELGTWARAAGMRCWTVESLEEKALEKLMKQPELPVGLRRLLRQIR